MVVCWDAGLWVFSYVCFPGGVWRRAYDCLDDLPALVVVVGVSVLGDLV